MKKCIFLFIAAALLFAGHSCGPVESPSAVRVHMFVSPDGSDSNPGTRTKPFATLAHACDAVRQIKKEGPSKDITVFICGGVYQLRDTVVFGPEDSGTAGHPVIYRAYENETPVLSGGRRITGWKPDTGGRWKAPTKIENFRQLYVNGTRATRARGGPLPGAELFGENGYKTTDVNMANWANQSDIELCYYVVWTHNRCKVESIERRGNHAIVTMFQPYFRYARTKEGVQVNLPSYIENAMELLDEPGEWYLDRSADTVYYIPKPGEDMKTAEVIAPAYLLEKLLELRGTLDEPVHDISFVGITFAHAGWLRPSKIGHIEAQANFMDDLNRLIRHTQPNVGSVVVTEHNENIKSPSNILCRVAKSIRFESCTFTKLGSGGIDLEYGSQDNTIIGCHFHDVAGTAIQVGDVLKDDHHPDDERKIVKNNKIVNNLIENCAVEYKSGVGIFAGYTDSTLVAHNEICNLPYSAISFGWGWGQEDAGGGAESYTQPFFYDTPTAAKNNRIEFNHIHHIMTKLHDGGGIYTLGNQPGTVIRANHIHDDRACGIYTDEGSGFIEVTQNLVYNVNNILCQNNRAQNRIETCDVHDNFFGVKPGDPNFPNRIAEQAGLEPAWQHLLKP